MTPKQKLKREVLICANEAYSLFNDEITVDNLDNLIEQHEDHYYDLMNNVREGDEQTDIPCDYSRHYESNSVAAKMQDGTWLGWTYWYGGGKHGEPEAVDWMEDAYELDVTEEQKTVTVRTFTKHEA